MDKEVLKSTPQVYFSERIEYCQSIDVLRFIGMLLIMGHYLYHIGFEGDYLFKNCWVWVDFYFILTGLFTYSHYQQIVHQRQYGQYGSEALSYTLRKFRRFFPITIVAIGLQYCMHALGMFIKGNVSGSIHLLSQASFEILYLSSSGLVGALLAPIWFLSAMFIVLPLIVYLIQAHSEFWKIIAFSVPITYFGYKGVNTDRAWPNDLVRAFACMSLGTIVYLLVGYIKTYCHSKINRKLSILEIFLFVFLIYFSAFDMGNTGLKYMELIFVIICVLMTSKVTCSSRINSKYAILLGKLTLPMFVFHWNIGTLASVITKNLYSRLVIYYLGTILISFLWIKILHYLRFKE